MHIDRDQRTGTYRVRPDDLTPSTAIVMAVAAITDRDENEIEPLSSVISPDALDALFATRLDGTERRGGQVSLRFAGFDVTVTEGELVLDPVPED